MEQVNKLEAQASALKDKVEDFEQAADHEAAQAACKMMSAKLVAAQALRQNVVRAPVRNVEFNASYVVCEVSYAHEHLIYLGLHVPLFSQARN